jgi:ParB-like chromosome segregation protein Spo0J
MVVAQAKRGRKPATDAGTLSGKTRVVGRGMPVWGPLQALPLERCRQHPANRAHSAASLAERRQSLSELGQLDPLKVWSDGGSDYLVLGGWGRVLSAQVLQWETIQARPLMGMRVDGRIVDPTELDLLAILAEDNSQRSELTLLEKAALGRRLREAGATGDEAARMVGFGHRSSLANAEKILDLPDSLRALASLPEEDPKRLPQATLRRLADYGHVPEIVEAILADLDDQPGEWRAHPEDSIGFILRDTVRAIDSASSKALNDWRNVPTKANALPAVTIPVLDDDGERIEINVTTQVKDWDRLLVEESKHARSGNVVDLTGRDDDEADEANEVTPATRTPTAAEKREAERQRAEQLAKRRRRWEYDFRHRAVLRGLEDPTTERIPGKRLAKTRIQVWAICENQRDARGKLASLVAKLDGNKKSRGEVYEATTQILQRIDGYAMPTFLDAMAVAVIQEPHTSDPDFPHVPFDLIVQLWDDLECDATREWRALYETEDGRELLRELWTGHDAAQLLAVASVAGIVPHTDRKKDLVEVLITAEIGKPSWVCDSAGGKKKR